MAWQEFNSHEDFNRAKEKLKDTKTQIRIAIGIACFVGFLVGLVVGISQ